MTTHPIAAVTAFGLSLSVAAVTAAGLLLGTGTGTGTAAVVEPLAETVDASAVQDFPLFRAGDASIPYFGRRIHYF